MSSSSDYSQWLYENRKYKGGRKEKFPLNRTYHFYCKKYVDTENQSSSPRNYHVALLDTGELVYTLTGWDKEEDARAHEGTIYVGKGVIHGKVVRCQD